MQCAKCCSRDDLTPSVGRTWRSAPPTPPLLLPLPWSSCKDRLDNGLMPFCSNASSMSNADPFHPSQCRDQSTLSVASSILVGKSFALPEMICFSTLKKQETKDELEMRNASYLLRNFSTWDLIKAFIIVCPSLVLFIHFLQVTTAFTSTLLATSIVLRWKLNEAAGISRQLGLGEEVACLLKSSCCCSLPRFSVASAAVGSLRAPAQWGLSWITEIWRGSRTRPWLDSQSLTITWHQEACLTSGWNQPY